MVGSLAIPYHATANQWSFFGEQEVSSCWAWDLRLPMLE